MGGFWPTTPNPFPDASTGLVDCFLDHVCRLDTLQIINVRFDANSVCLTPNSRHSLADVRYRADFVCFTPESRRGSGRSRESEGDPKRTSAICSRILPHGWELASELCPQIAMPMALSKDAGL